MTQLFTPEGSLDYAAARSAATSIGTVGNDNARAKLADELTAAALVDIAASLRALVGIAGTEYGPDGPTEVDPEREPDDAPVDFEPGDWVVGKPGATDTLGNVWQVAAVGESEGLQWIAGADGVRVWANLHDKAERPTDAEGFDFDDPDEETGHELPDGDDVGTDFEKPSGDALDDAERCRAPYPGVDDDDPLAGVRCARLLGHDVKTEHRAGTKHRKGNLKW